MRNQYVKIKKTGQIGFISAFMGTTLHPNCNYAVTFNVKKPYNDSFRTTYVLGKNLEIIK